MTPQAQSQASGQSLDPAAAPYNLTLAVLIAGGWIAAHLASLLWVDLATTPWYGVVALMLLNCWLSVGIFIVAHDCMHGSLVPFRPAVNRNIGRLCMILYAGFDYDALNRKHHLHHRHAGTADDPDFHDHEPHGYWLWFAKFMREYFGWREWAHMSLRFFFYLLVLGAPMWNIILLWVIPILASSHQLFLFGTWLPHRPSAMPFADRHRSRSNDYDSLLSMLTCFHFGYHHEHHLQPYLPWWRLPQAHRRLKAGDTP